MAYSRIQTRVVRPFLTLVFLGLVPVACCPEETRDYVKFGNVNLTLTEAAPGSPALVAGARTSAPELLVGLRFEYEFVVAAQGGSPFVSQAHALQCEEPGGKGLKDKLTAVTLTSNSPFNGVPAGQSLEAFVRCTAGSSRYSNLDFPLTQLDDSLNAWQSPEFYAPVKLRIGPKPTGGTPQRFTVRIRTSSGQEIEQSAPEIIWD
jgi:hypothetical protein